MTQPTTTICLVITTRNRKPELQRALISAIAQDYPHFEIRVYDDASDDGTENMVRTQFPTVLFVRAKKPQGYIGLRNQGYQDTDADWVISIDDDAWFTSKHTVSQIAEQIPSQGKIAAFALPYLESLPIARSVSYCTVSTGKRVRSFVGTAHVCHRETFLKLGGYREFLIHQGEERDYCIRLFEAGYEVKMAEAPPLVHGVSPKRDIGRMHRWGTRNVLLFDMFYTPGRIVIPLILRHMLKSIAYRFSFRRALTTIKWIAISLPDLWKYRSYRTPLSFDQFREYFGLPNHGPVFRKETDLPAPATLSRHEVPI